jgi:cytochrome b involved in lipid metabolism
VSDFVNSHPGGKSIEKGCGKDATEMFNAKPGSGKPHSDNAKTLLEKYYVGSLRK